MRGGEICLSTLTVPLKSGLTKSLQMLWLLTKIIVPVSCLIALLEYWGIMESLASLFAPLMAWTGLPGEAAIALALGFLVNYYAAIGAIIGMALSTAEITTLAVMLSISHELPVETIICTHTGLRIPFTVVLRVGIALVVGMSFNLFMTAVGI